MLIAVVMVFGMIPVMSFAEEFDTENFVGLVLTVKDSSFTVEMYKGITSQKTLLTPVYTEGNSYYYEVQSGAHCYFVTSENSGYYDVRRNLYITAEDAQKKIEWDVTPAVRSTSGWDHTEIHSYADVVMENAFPSSPELWPDYAELLKVPALTNSRTDHQMTTQTEMMDYISSLDGAEDNMYVFTLGKSGSKDSTRFDIPVVFYSKTDLSGAQTWEEAAELLRANGKLTALYQAQVHGNEPAAGEAALAMLKAFDGSYGAGLLDNMNICVLPRLNVYGGYKASRYVYNNGKEIDPNRDFVRLRSEEIKLRTQLFLALEPEVYFDNHEYQVRVTNDPAAIHDVKLNAVFVTKSTDAFKSMSLTLANAAFDRAEENNLGYGWYDDSVNGYNASVGTTNVSMRGCLSFLTETNGIMGGNQQLERRMMSHISVVTGILDYVNANTAEVQKVVDDQRNDIVQRGRTYEESDIIVLKTGSTDRPDLYIEGKQVSSGGKVTEKTYTSKVFDVVQRSRIAPTAYVIPAGEEWAEAVVENLSLNGIACTKIPAGSVVRLQQYTGTTTEAALTEEKEVSFPQGAYVMTMAQENAHILAVRMEPDMSDGSSNLVTFAQEGVITADNDVFPIYRYIRDLNEDDFIDYDKAFAAPAGLTAESVTVVGGTGKITGLDANKTYEYRAADAEEYTAVAAGAAEIADLPVGEYLVRYTAVQDDRPSADAVVTVRYALNEYAVYLDSVNGSDDHNGYSEDFANKTFLKAQQQLDALMAHAPDGAAGIIRIIGTYEITTSNEAYSLQAYTYPLLITGGKLKYTNTSTAGRGRYLRMGGDTTFANITLETGSDKKDYFLCGEGYKLTVGENVISLPGDPTVSKPVCYFSIAGGVGEYNNNKYAETTDVTVRSGHWRYIYAGGYVSSVRKEANVAVSGCSVASVYMTHNGKHDGNVYCELENVTIRDDVICCGNFQKNNIAGDVTLVLKEGVSCASVYAGSYKGGDVKGTVTIVADGVDLTNTSLYGKARNDTGTIGGLALELRQGQLTDVTDSYFIRDGVSVKVSCEQEETFKLPCDIALELDGVDLNVDLNGHDITAVTVGSDKLCCKDSVTDDYTVDGETYGTVPADTAIAAPGYMPITEAGKTSFHKYEMELEYVNISPSRKGISYTTTFHGDEAVKAQVKEFGIAMRLYAAPNETTVWADPDGLTHVALAQSEWQTGNHEQAVKSVYIKNIVDWNATDAENLQRAAIPIYGRSYIKLQNGEMLFSEAVGFSMESTMEEADRQFAALAEKDQQALVNMYLNEENHSFMQTWEIPNIKSAAGEIA